MMTTGSFIKTPVMKKEKGHKIYRYVCTNPRCGYTFERVKPFSWRDALPF